MRMRGVVATGLAVLAVTAAVRTDADEPLRSPSLPFERMTYEDVEAAGTLGAGCSWSERARDRTRVLSMTDDRAAVKRGGKLVALRPARNARDLAPFTYDLWEGGGMTIAVRKTGRSRPAGTAVEGPAALSVTIGGETKTYAGRLNCGT